MTKTNIVVTLAFDDISTENIDTELQIQKDILKLLEKCKKEGNISHYVVADDEVISDKLKEQETKTGHWERHYSRPNVYADLFWHCSECGYKNSTDHANMYYHYCPNCGAKMESEE